MTGLAAALARVPSPVRRWSNGEGYECEWCRIDREYGAPYDLHNPGCPWPPFVGARDALAAGVTVEGVVFMASEASLAINGSAPAHTVLEVHRPPPHTFKRDDIVTVTVTPRAPGPGVEPVKPTHDCPACDEPERERRRSWR